MMRIAVAGATGHIGSLTVTALEEAGHSVVRISRAHGVDLVTGDRLDDALAGVEAVVDTTNSNATDTHEAVAYLGTLTRNLLAAEQRAAVRHHVLLSIVGIDHVDGNAHYAGKREQERLVAEGSVPWTNVRAGDGGQRAAAERRRPDRAHHVRRVAAGRSTLKQWS